MSVCLKAITITECPFANKHHPWVIATVAPTVQIDTSFLEIRAFSLFFSVRWYPLAWSMASHNQNTSTIAAEIHELLTCDICAESYDNDTRRARFLECYHTFCSQCLLFLANKRHKTIQCPNCRHSTQMPKDWVDGLQTNFYIENLKAVSKKTTKQTTAKSNATGCHKHVNQPLFFFCETCETAICRHCTVLDHAKADGHCIVNFADAVTNHRHTLQERLHASYATKAYINRTMHDIESRTEMLHACKDTAISSLRSMAQYARQRIDQGEQQVASLILQQYDTQHSTLLDKQLHLKQATKLLDKHINLSEQYVKTGGIGEMISITETLERATERFCYMRYKRWIFNIWYDNRYHFI